jgi:hypothetical protein
VNKVFRPAERSRLVYEILLRCPYRSPEAARTGKTIDNFLSYQNSKKQDEILFEILTHFFRNYACFII